MKLLLDTHLLLRAANALDRLSAAVRDLLENPDNILVFIAAVLLEITIKGGLGRADFRVDARVLQRGLLDNGYEELAVTSACAVAANSLPPIHKDLFVRLLVAQATVEGVVLVSTHTIVAQYPGPVQLV